MAFLSHNNANEIQPGSKVYQQFVPFFCCLNPPQSFLKKKKKKKLTENHFLQFWLFHEYSCKGFCMKVSFHFLNVKEWDHRVI